MWIEIILVSLTMLFLWQTFKKPSNYPPGPWGLPLLGYISIGKKSVVEIIQDLSKKHGGIISWRLGSQLMVFVSDYKLMKEAFLGNNFVDRPDLKVFNIFEDSNRLGLVASNGVHWHTIRRFSLRHLRDLGMGKSRLSSAIQFEATEIVKELSKTAGKPAPLSHSLITSVLNVVWQLVASKRYDLNDEQIMDFYSSITRVQEYIGRMTLPDFFPWVKNVIPEFLLNKILRVKLRIETTKKIRSFLQGSVDEHKKNLDPNDPKDFIDAYLIEMENQKSDPTSTFSDEDLIETICDLFVAGSETTTNTILWAIFYLTSFPEVQKKLQKEIDENLPKGSSATPEDKLRLPYTEAFVHEVLRYSALINTGVFHMATVDSNLGGYLIPKGALVTHVPSTTHFDPKYFSRPNEFRPEAYINAEGKFVAPKEGFVPFGLGRRQCIGESLARMEIFIYITTLVQNLNFAVPPGNSLDLKPKEFIPFINLPRVEQDIFITTR